MRCPVNGYNFFNLQTAYINVKFEIPEPVMCETHETVTVQVTITLLP